MDIQSQVYGAAQAKLARLCSAEWHHAKKNKRGRLMAPLTYSAEVERLIEISSEVLSATSEEAEELMAEMTYGAIQAKVLG